MSTPTPTASIMDSLVALAKRRGFVYQASEIYGGIRGFWDYGPLGVLLKNNIRDWWWRCMVECPPIGPDGSPIDMVGLDSSIIQHPKTWEASGHTATFSDPVAVCGETRNSYRADHLVVYYAVDRDQPMFALMSGATPEEIAKRIKQLKLDARAEFVPVAFTSIDAQFGAGTLKAWLPKIVAPDTKTLGTLCEPRPFNLMLFTFPGSVQSDDTKAWLRPETAQGIFLNYKNVLDTTRVKVPFGVAQVGKSFRNELTPRNFIFRSREFEQMEMEFFCPPDDALKWYDFWKHERMKWWLSLGIKPENLIFRDHATDELSHYSKATVDIEYKYPFTAPEFGELEGIAHRGDYDLSQHQKHSGAKLDYFDQELQLRLKAQGVPDDEVKKRSRYVPNVIEPASGLTRAVLVMLCEAYTVEARAGVEKFEYFRFKPQFAPVKAGIFPLVNKDGMPEIANKLYGELRTQFTCEYDAKQSIGKRYARMDEIGTPFSVTIDGETAKDNSVTIRERDTQAQTRVNLDKVSAFIRAQL